MKCSRTSVQKSRGFRTFLPHHRIGSVFHRADGIFHSENLVNSASLAVLPPPLLFWPPPTNGTDYCWQCGIARERVAAFLTFPPKLFMIVKKANWNSERNQWLQWRTDSQCISRVECNRPESRCDGPEKWTSSNFHMNPPRGNNLASECRRDAVVASSTAIFAIFCNKRGNAKWDRGTARHGGCNYRALGSLGQWVLVTLDIHLT